MGGQRLRSARGIGAELELIQNSARQLTREAGFPPVMARLASIAR